MERCAETCPHSGATQALCLNPFHSVMSTPPEAPGSHSPQICVCGWKESVNTETEAKECERGKRKNKIEKIKGKMLHGKK